MVTDHCALRWLHICIRGSAEYIVARTGLSVCTNQTRHLTRTVVGDVIQIISHALWPKWSADWAPCTLCRRSTRVETLINVIHL